MNPRQHNITIRRATSIQNQNKTNKRSIARNTRKEREQESSGTKTQSERSKTHTEKV